MISFDVVRHIVPLQHSEHITSTCLVWATGTDKPPALIYRGQFMERVVRGGRSPPECGKLGANEAWKWGTWKKQAGDESTRRVARSRCSDGYFLQPHGSSYVMSGIRPIVSFLLACDGTIAAHTTARAVRCSSEEGRPMPVANGDARIFFNQGSLRACIS